MKEVMIGKWYRQRYSCRRLEKSFESYQLKKYKFSLSLVFSLELCLDESKLQNYFSNPDSFLRGIVNQTMSHFTVHFKQKI
ncbi:hypothetical protein BpHYR1_025413 [Brachionus plicatilis]|uniref:Uncharacterized protein n=1 Tax=Brachionus plicatilis TaxID=10195 RepID=A0A3M7SYC7_BRAPC|nr:hypothetical protein BpHYR1_025413 [Brachionus plicatilis]